MKSAIDAFNEISGDGMRIFGDVESIQGPKDSAPKITVNGSKNFYDPSQKITPQTIVGIGSITKQFTAATLLKIWDNELTARKSDPTAPIYFEKGIDTALKNFLPLLVKNYPSCVKLFEQIAGDKNFDKITLRDLLNHTHGLGARNNDQAYDLVRKADDHPLELPAIVAITEKRKDEQYGQHLYGNFGYDLAAMIIEVTTGMAFDEAVKELVLKPHQLNHTHPQSDHAGLYQDKKSDVATGYAIDRQDSKALKEFKMNKTSNTRAAGGFKSNVEDLTKFAPLFMDGQMFANEQVKEAVLDRKKGAAINGGPETYHLAIRTEKDGTIGHTGADTIYTSQLRYNPVTKEVRAGLQVIENLTDYVTRKIFTNLHPKDAAKLENMAFWEDCGFLEKFNKAGRPRPGSKECDAVIKEALEASPETLQLMEKYAQIRDKIIEIPAEKLCKNPQEIIDGFSKKPGFSPAKPKAAALENSGQSQQRD